MNVRLQRMLLFTIRLAVYAFTCYVLHTKGTKNSKYLPMLELPVIILVITELEFIEISGTYDNSRRLILVSWLIHTELVKISNFVHIMEMEEKIWFIHIWVSRDRDSIFCDKPTRRHIPECTTFHYHSLYLYSDHYYNTREFSSVENITGIWMIKLLPTSSGMISNPKLLATYT
jgi:hypothetical protein